MSRTNWLKICSDHIYTGTILVSNHACQDSISSLQVIHFEQGNMADLDWMPTHSSLKIDPTDYKHKTR